MASNSTSDIEGTLWKWTNYFTGWQARWFVLENGVLSYYRSQDDVTNGCKGSIKMSVCDVNVHPTDNTRLDLIIPGEAHFYVKASTPQERQQWLVALGSSKAGLQTLNGVPTVRADEISEDELRTKKSELRLYCDLLMQQVHSIKQAAGKDKDSSDYQALADASSLLGPTCDTFIKTLEDCMRLVNASHVSTSVPVTPTTPDARVTGVLPDSPAKKTPNIRTNNPWHQVQKSASVDRYIPSSSSRGARTKASRSGSGSRSRTPSGSSVELSAASSAPDRQTSVADTVSSADSSPVVNKYSSDQNGLLLKSPSFDEDDEIEIDTLFNAMPVSFMDVRLQEDGGIPVVPFLDACRAVLVVFDKLNPTAFMPVKLDISGNIKKIDQKYTTDPERFPTLQSIVLYEVEHRQNLLSQSATIALLWLKRAVEFIREFLFEFMLGTPDLGTCAGNAYAKTLRKYHGMVVRGVFALAQKAVPYREDFIAELATREEDRKNVNLEKVVIRQTEAYVTAQDELIRILRDFYHSLNLDLDEEV